MALKDNFYNDETPPPPPLLRKFLLGDVSDDLRAEIEDRFLADEDFMSGLLVVEDELIEDYIAQRLSSSEKESFEKVFLTNPRRRERVFAIKGVIAAANAEKVSVPQQNFEEDSPSVFAFPRFENVFARLAFAAIALLLVIASAWFLISRLNPNRDDRIATVNKTPENINLPPTPLPEIPPTPKLDPTPQPTPKLSPTPKPQIPEQTFAAIVLRPTILRDVSNAPKLLIAPSVKQARIQLNLERDDYKSYVVRITTVEGSSVWQGGPIVASRTKSGRAILLNLPAKILSPNDYIIELSGVSETGPIESFADYFFSVARK